MSKINVSFKVLYFIYLWCAKWTYDVRRGGWANSLRRACCLVR